MASSSDGKKRKIKRFLDNCEIESSFTFK